MSQNPVFSSSWMESTLGRASQPGTARHFSEMTSDSRKIPPQSLFIALKGDRFDGHDFVAAALEKGAAGVLVSRTFWDSLAKTTTGLTETFKDRWFFVAPDVEGALTRLGQAWRETFQPHPVIAVGGSVGKTTTKELLAALLRGRFERGVLKTEGSQNGFVGIPSTLLKLRPSEGTKIAVIEIGIDEPGTMKGHAATVRPDLALLTAIAPEHLEKLKDLETVAHEELVLLEETLRLQDSSQVLLNLDEPFIARWLARMPKDFKARCIGASLQVASAPTTVAPSFLGKETENGELEITEMGQVTTRLSLPLPGEHHARNLLLAAAAARTLGLTWEEIKRGLKTFRGAFGRTEVKTLDDGTWAICDYYNANPASVRAGLSVLEALARKKELSTKQKPSRWACLGDMLELGTEELALHRELTSDVVAAQVDHLLLFGPRMKALAEALAHSPVRVSHFETREALGQALAHEAPTDSVILLKGSRGMKMEEAWKVACAARPAWAKGI